MAYFFNHRNAVLLALLFICLFLTVPTLQYAYDGIVHPVRSEFVPETRYVLPSHLVKMFSFGFDNVLADFYWIGIIQDFSIWDGKDPFYLNEYRNLSTLDPHFGYPYLLGILTFTSREANYKEAPLLYRATIETFEPIAQIGMKNIPESWEIPFYMGTAFQLMKVPDKAIYYLKIAGEKKEAPDLVKRVYETYLKNILAGTDASSLLIKTIYDTTKSPTTKKIVEEGLLVKSLTAALTAVVEEYKTAYGRYPTSLDELIVKKMINNNTELKRDYDVSIDANTGEVTVTKK